MYSQFSWTASWSLHPIKIIIFRVLCPELLIPTPNLPIIPGLLFCLVSPQ